MPGQKTLRHQPEQTGVKMETAEKIKDYVQRKLKERPGFFGKMRFDFHNGNCQHVIVEESEKLPTQENDDQQ